MMESQFCSNCCRRLQSVCLLATIFTQTECKVNGEILTNPCFTTPIESDMSIVTLSTGSETSEVTHIHDCTSFLSSPSTVTSHHLTAHHDAMTPQLIDVYFCQLHDGFATTTSTLTFHFWNPSITDDVFLFSRGRSHVLKKLKVRRGCTVPSPLTWPSTKKLDSTEDFAMTGSVDGCGVLPETQFVGTRLRMDTTWVFYVGGFLPPMRPSGERPEFDIKLPLGAPVLIFPRGYLLKSSTRGYFCRTARI